MKAERLQALADVYGADLRRWPADQRAFAESLLAADPSLRAVLDEAATLGHLARMPSFLLGAPRCASRPLCSVCGYWGDVQCIACGETCCSRACVATHHETRCERPIG